MHVLIFGATGNLGQPVAHQLQADGHSVTVFARDAAEARAVFPKGFHIVTGDITDQASLKQAMQGVDAVHISLSGGNTEQGIQTVMGDGVRNIVAAASSAGAGRISFLSGCYTDPAYTWVPVVKGNALAEQAIKAGSVPYTIFRPTSFMESLALYVQGKRASVVGGQPHPIHWLAPADYARMASKALATPEAANKTFTLFGPQAIPMKAALEQYTQAAAPEAKVSTMPPFLFNAIATMTRSDEMKATGKLLKLFNEVPEPGDPSEANRILGAPTTTLAAWLASQKKK
jgi:uncharacterized protein YbjT (DUF2867 family)